MRMWRIAWSASSPGCRRRRRTLLRSSWRRRERSRRRRPRRDSAQELTTQEGQQFQRTTHAYDARVQSVTKSVGRAEIHAGMSANYTAVTQIRNRHSSLRLGSRLLAGALRFGGGGQANRATLSRVARSAPAWPLTCCTSETWLRWSRPGTSTNSMARRTFTGTSPGRSGRGSTTKYGRRATRRVIHSWRRSKP